MYGSHFPGVERAQGFRFLQGLLSAVFALYISANSVSVASAGSQKMDQPRTAAPNMQAADVSTGAKTAPYSVTGWNVSPQNSDPAELGSPKQETNTDQVPSPKSADPSAKSADADDDDDYEGEPHGGSYAAADLAVHLTPGGTASVVFTQYGASTDFSAGVDELGKSLGCPLLRIQGAGRKAQYRADNCRMAVRGSGLHYLGELKLTPLFESLREAKVNQLSVSVWQEKEIAITCSPKPNLTVASSGCQYTILFSYLPSLPRANADVAAKLANFFQAPDSLPRIEISYGITGAEIGRTAAVLGIVLLLPICVTLWMRRAALNAAERIAAGLRTADATSGHAGSIHDDRAGIWFGYWRSLNWVLNGSLFLWWGASDTMNLRGLLAMVLQNGGSGQASFAFHLFDRIGFWLPPLVVVAICQTLSHPVQVRVRGLQWTRGEVLKQSLWSMAASWLPLLLFLNGINEAFTGNSRVGVMWMVAGFVCRTYAARQSAVAQGLIPRALTSGELRDSIFGMATKLKVKLTQVFVVATGKARLANAFARTGNSILLTDTLLGSLNRREVDAVVAHELAHLKHDHPRKLGTAYILGLVAAIALVAFIPAGQMYLRPFRYLLYLIVPQAITYFFSRRFEYTADKEAVLLTGDAEAQITSLVKIHRMNLMPIDWGRVQGKFLTHPTTVLRARAIARAGGILEQRVPGILEQALHDEGSISSIELNNSPATPFGSASPAMTVTGHMGADRELSFGDPSSATGDEFRAALPYPPALPSPVASGIQTRDRTGAVGSLASGESRGKVGAMIEAPPNAGFTPVIADQSPKTLESYAQKFATPVAPAEAEQYSLPATASGEEKVFSSTYKHRNAFRNVWIFIASLIFPPAFIALALHHSHLGGKLRWAAYAVGWIVSLAFSLVVRDRLQSWEAPRMRRHLREKMERSGADPATWGGRFVGLSPHAAPRSYESMSVWDIGYVFVYPDRICYWGEEARFALRRNQITSICVATGPPGWFHPQSIYVSWREKENTGTFNLRVGDVSNVQEMGRQTRLFAERLQGWIERPPFHRDLPPALAKLGVPRFGEVTGALPTAGSKPRALFGTTILLWIVSWAVCVMFGLPVLGLTYPLIYISILLSSAAGSLALRHAMWAALPSAPGWYVILTAWTLYLVHIIPNWFYRDPKPPGNIT
jgi:Zn-dependent protease with chaperone function